MPVDLSYVPKNATGEPPIELIVKCVFIPYIGAVQPTDSSFNIRCDFDFEWKATPSDLAASKASPDSYRPSFVPQLVFQNAKEVEQTEVEGVNGNPFKITDQGHNYLRLKVVGTFIEQYELQSFPVDVQQLKMSISVSFLSAEQLVFVPPQNPDGSPFTFAFLLGRYSALPEWNLRRVLCDFDIKDAFTHLIVVVQIQRIPSAVMHKGIVPTLIYTYSAFFNVVLDPIDQYEARMAVLVTLLLAFTALQQYAGNHMPTVSYLTLYDKYVLGCFLALVGVLSLSFAVGQYNRVYMKDATTGDLDHLKDMDRYFHYVFLGLLTVMQIVFGVMFLRCRAREIRKLSMSFEQLAQHEKELNGSNEDLILTQSTSELRQANDDKQAENNAARHTQANNR